MIKLAVAVLAVLTGSADVTGTWSATAETRFPSGKVETHPLTFVFKQTDTSLIGSVGPDAAHQFPISKGRAVHDSLTFDCKWGNGALLHFALVAKGKSLEGLAEGDSAQVPANPGPNYTNRILLTLRKVEAP
jgi:hypothetical protein